MPIGPPVPPLPADCPVNLALLTPAEANALHPQVGALCVVVIGATAEELARAAPLDELRPYACRLGGDILVASGFCSLGKVSGVEFGVYRER